MQRYGMIGLLAVLLTTETTSVTYSREEAQEKPPLSLFNGNDLKGWKLHNPKDGVWRVEDEMIVGQNALNCWLITEQTYKDFELRLEYRLGVRGNGGTAIRSPAEGDPAFAGMEIQILDDPSFKGQREEQKTGGIYDVVGPQKSPAKPAGQWNKMRIVANGVKITVEINDVEVLNTNLEDHKDRLNANPAKNQRAHPGLLRPSGHIGLQAFGGTVAYRNLRIRSIEK